MGLVMASLLSVLPAAVSPDSAAPVSQSAGTTDTTATDSFAALLAMLAEGAMTVSVPAGLLVGVSATLPGEAPAAGKAGKDPSKDSPLAAALAATTFLPFPVPAAPVSEPAIGTGAATGKSPGTTAAAAPLTASLRSLAPGATAVAPALPVATDPSASQISLAPGAIADTPAPSASLSAALSSVVPAAGTGTSTPPATADPSDLPPSALLPSVVPAASTDGPTPPAAPDRAGTAPESPPAISLAPALARTSGAEPAAQEPTRPSEAPIPVALDVGDVGASAKPPATAQPPGTAVPRGIEISVVRSVGNAQQSQTTSDAAHDGASSGQKQETSSTPVAQALNSTAAVAGPLVTASPPAVAQAPHSSAPAHVTPEPVAQVAQVVLDRAERGGGEVHIRLDPPELGAVTIHVRIDGDRVQVQVQAERHDAMNLLRQNTLDLSTLLGSRGLNLTDVNVGLGGRQAQGDDQSNANPAPRPANGEFASILGVDETPATELHNRLQSAYNPDGLHIYRV